MNHAVVKVNLAFPIEFVCRKPAGMVANSDHITPGQYNFINACQLSST